MLKTVWGFAGGALIMAALAGPAAAQGGDAEAGKRVFRQCMTCHVVQPGMNRVGPSLHNIVGKEAAAVDGFTRYSKAMKESGIVWTPENLDAYLESPRALVPGGTMAFAGLRNPKQRADVIAYLIEHSPDYAPAEGAGEAAPAEATDG